MDPTRSFQGLLLTLQRFWAERGCVVLQPYDMEVGAGTFHPATTLRALGPRSWKAAYVQPSRRPKDGRYGENPNRLQHYYQFQVILKPSPPDLQQLYLDSLQAIGVDLALHDVRFVEDDWESPTLGAWGLGWECWCDGMEVSQFTYFQQVAGVECAPVAGELTYGLERLAMYVQGVENVYDLNFNGGEGEDRISYGDVFLQAEQEFSRHNFEHANTEMLFRHFTDARALALFADVAPTNGQAGDMQRQPARRGEGLGALIDETTLDERIGDQFLQVLGRLALHAGGDLFGEEFKQEIRHQLAPPPAVLSQAAPQALASSRTRRM